MTIRDFLKFGRQSKVKKPVNKSASKKTDGDGYIKVTEHLRTLYSADVGKWRRAHQSAISTLRPRYVNLMDVYEDALLDPHLSAVLQHRTLNVLNTPFRIKKDSEIDEALTRLFNKRWMYDLIQEIQCSIYFGYSCIEFKFDDNGEVSGINSILRHHIVPQKNSLLPNTMLDEGIDITEAPYNNVYVLVKNNSLGLLLECAKYAIFKKHATAHWQQLQQLFGIPMRVGRTNSRKKAVIDKIFKSLKNMGTAGYGVLPEGTAIEIIENGKNDPYNIFMKAIEVVNNELSMRVLGTPNSDKGGSYAKEKVNYDRHNDLTYADLRYVAFVINDQVLPLLSKWGYDLEGAEFDFDPTWSLKVADSQLEVDKWLLENYELSKDYIYDTYGVQVEDKEKPQATPVAEPTPKATPQNPQKKKLDISNTLYTNVQGTGYLNWLLNTDVNIDALPTYFEKMVKDIYDQKVKDGIINQDLYFKTADQMWAAVIKEIGSSNITNGSRTANWLQLQQRNLYAFSAAKSYAEMKTLRDLVFDGTQIRAFTEFRKDALNIYGIYNENWLKSEFEAVKKGTIAAKKWQQIQRDKDIYPYLMYKTKGDNRVREEHRKLDGMIFHVDNPIWDILYPPNGWGCRCYVVQLRKSDLTAEQLKRAESKAEAEYAERLYKEENPNKYWHKNVGKQPILDTQNTTYMNATPVRIGELEAVKHYGLRTIDRILEKPDTLPNLKTDEVTVSDWFASLQSKYKTDGRVDIPNTILNRPIGVDAEFVEFIEAVGDFEDFITIEFENILNNPNEVWDTNTDMVVFVKYYKDKVVGLYIRQDEISKAWIVDTVDVNKAVYRKGILLHRK